MIKKTGLLGLLLAAVVALAGCGPEPITLDRVQRSFGSTFLNLYANQQAQLGRPSIRAATTYGTASCVKGSPSSPQKGPGDDWTCVEQWRSWDGKLLIATYDLQVQTDSCYTAIGPTNVVGQPKLTAPDAHLFVNPLYQIYACFNAL